VLNLRRLRPEGAAWRPQTAILQQIPERHVMSAVALRWRARNALTSLLVFQSSVLAHPPW
jgi:hypothetical protein